MNNKKFIYEDMKDIPKVPKQSYRTKEYEREYKRFQNTCTKIPDYIKVNLKNMPNNKGYIFRGIWLFGDLPTEKKRTDIVLFENICRNNLKIHEINKGIYKI